MTLELYIAAVVTYLLARTIKPEWLARIVYFNAFFMLFLGALLGLAECLE